MAILGFHFSGVYKDSLFSGKKTATIMPGQQLFNIGEEIQVYLSEKPDLFEGFDEKRIGRAVIEKVEIKRIKDLTEQEAMNCGSKGLEELKTALIKWYNACEDSIITHIKFNLEIY